jgi:hypothetical protein
VAQSNLDMEALLKSLHEDEQRQIRASREDLIAQIRSIPTQNTDLRVKMNLLCKAVTRIYMLKRDWMLAPPHGLETVEPVVTEVWTQLKPDVHPTLRTAALTGCLGTTNQSEVQKFFALADKLMPM